MGKGFLKVEIFVAEHTLPVSGCSVIIKNQNGETIYNLISDENGLTNRVELFAPDYNASLFDGKGAYSPFTPYEVEIRHSAKFKQVYVHGVQIFDSITTILPVQLHPSTQGSPDNNIDDIVIPKEHGVDFDREQLNGEQAHDYFERGLNPPLQPEQFVEALQLVTGNEVAIPHYITVHLGSPNAVAENLRVSFSDYIKNVASSEIFPFWNEAAIYANIYSQISFALNRVYTVWYRSQSKDFDITNSTAFDQFFVKGRDIFENISRIVDNIFNVFIRRQGRREPFFASYCNGTTSTCDGLSQHGSQELAQRGYSAIQILRYYFPNDIQLTESNNFTYSTFGAFPGYSLKEGTSGSAVKTMQVYLNRISGSWYIPPAGVPDGVFGASTKASVIAFQRLFNLTPDGIIGKSTWYQITRIYTAAKELAELTSEGERISIGAAPPTVTIGQGSRGEYVVELQFLLNFISEFFPVIPFVIQNGVFNVETTRAVVEFQKAFGLTADGIVGPGTWNKLYSVYKDINGAVVIPPGETEPPTTNVPQFPGTPLTIGSTGTNVSLMQNHLNSIARVYTSIPVIAADGVFGAQTQAAVKEFQRIFGLTADGIIGSKTWYKIIDIYNNLTIGQQPPFPGTPLRIGSRGNDVQVIQGLLRDISAIFPAIPSLAADGIFGTGTQASVIAFQRLFGLTADGVIGKYTWEKIVYIYNTMPASYAPAYPGTALRVGSRGSNVLIMQQFLNNISKVYPDVPSITADGVFGNATENAVKAFQREFGLTADGVIGLNTWNMIISINSIIMMNQARRGVSSVSMNDARRGGNKINPALIYVVSRLIHP